MSSTRTQIYLTADQRSKIDQLSRDEGIPLAEVVRRALDRYFEDLPDVEEALDATFGALRDLEVPERSEWDRSAAKP